MKGIVLLGDRDPMAITHRALDAAIALLPPGIQARWVATDSIEATRLGDADGVWVVSGSPYANAAHVFAAITYARTSGEPFLGTCGGFQHAIAVELRGHPFFVATLFQPQVDLVSSGMLHPVIEAFLRAANGEKSCR